MSDVVRLSTTMNWLGQLELVNMVSVVTLRHTAGLQQDLLTRNLCGSPR